MSERGSEGRAASSGAVAVARASVALAAIIACGAVGCSQSTIGAGGDPAGGSGDRDGIGGGDRAASGDRDAVAGDDRAPADDASGDSLGGDATGGDSVGGDAAPGGDVGGGDSSGGDVGGGDTSGGDVGGGDLGGGDDSTVTPGMCGAEGVCVRLTWSSSGGDLDLHLSKDGGAYCSQDTCYFGNCKDGAAYRVEWDAAAGLSSGDPTLEDDLWGSGPEVIRVPAPVPGTYVLGVRFSPGAPSGATATVEVTSGGVSLGTFDHAMEPGTFWEAASFTVTAGGAVTGLGAASRYCAAGAWICNDAVGGCPPG